MCYISLVVFGKGSLPQQGHRILSCGGVSLASALPMPPCSMHYVSGPCQLFIPLQPNAWYLHQPYVLQVTSTLLNQICVISHIEFCCCQLLQVADVNHSHLLLLPCLCFLGLSRASFAVMQAIGSGTCCLAPDVSHLPSSRRLLSASSAAGPHGIVVCEFVH